MSPGNGTDTIAGPRQSQRGPGPSPHPRIRARRIEVRRDEGRRRRRRLVGLVAVLAVIAVVAVVARSPLFEVHEITVQGAVHTPVAAIDRASGITRGDALIDVEAGSAAHRILSLPWVRTASVERSWPQAVHIVVSERVAVAQVQTGKAWASLDVTGRVLALHGHRAPGLVLVRGLAAGVPGSSVAGSALGALRLAADLSPALAAQVVSIGSDRGDLSLVLHTDAIHVRIGPATQLRAKLQALSAVLANAPRTPPISTIDVIVPSAPVLTRRGQGLDQ